MPVRKDAAALLAAGDRDTALTDAACLVFMGTTVISGSALAVVIATGRSALFGGLSRAFQWQRPRTRFERGMNSTSWMLMAFTAVTVPVSMLVTGIAGGDWLQALLFGVSVAVGLTPEMLPLIVTVCLSRGARTMASGKAIVRRLDAIETLGGMDVLCVGKTGTLTSGVIKLDRAQSMSGLNSSYVLHAAWLTTLIPHTTSNPWDDAIVAAEGDSAKDTGDVQVEGGTPFDPIRRRATVIVAKSHHRADREHTGGSDISETSGAGAGTSGNVSRIMVVKGAVSEMLPRCDTVMRNGTAEPLTDRLRGTYERLMADKATHGYRVLLVAQRSVTDQTTVQDDRALTLLGYLTFLDLPKPDAADTIAHMHNAGITVTMLTGDEPQVARTVARKVGINARRVVTGRTLDDMTDTALGTELRRVNVFAKLTPEHKARIVSLLRREGHCVGYMGDGVNDLPAMHASEIAISASTGSEAVRQSADVMLTHKNLDVLLRGITQSRRTCVNMMKYIKLALSSNFGNIISVMIAGAFLPFVPMAPVQMVLLNLIYDLACLAIPWDRVDGDVLRSPARWDTASIARFMSRFGPVSSLFDMVTFTVLLTLLCPAVAGGRFPELHGDGSRLLFVAAFQTGWFVVSMWTQITALHMLRTERVPFIGSRASVPLVCTSLAALTIATALPFTPVGAWMGFHVPPVSLFALLSIGLGALIGLERQLRARSAGIRTNALVSLGSCLFTTVGVYTLAAGTGDPTRVAAQVASGIGFLGAGVILKQGVSVSGLNTAATLWASAAVGTLCGSGMEAAAAIGATAIMLANMMLRPIGAAIDARRTAQSHEAEGIRYTLEVKCLRKDEQAIRALVFNALHQPGFIVQSIAASDLPDDLVVITTVVATHMSSNIDIESSIETVTTPEVLGVKWDAEQITAVD